MHQRIDPLAISPKPHSDDRIIHVHLPAGKIGEKIQALEAKWKQVFPDFGFNYWFIDDEFGRMYENETQVAEITEKFSALANYYHLRWLVRTSGISLATNERNRYPEDHGRQQCTSASFVVGYFRATSSDSLRYRAAGHLLLCFTMAVGFLLSDRSFCMGFRRRYIYDDAHHISDRRV